MSEALDRERRRFAEDTLNLLGIPIHELRVAVVSDYLRLYASLAATEAVSAERARLREEIEAMPTRDIHMTSQRAASSVTWTKRLLSRDDVLARLAPEQETT